MNFTSAQSSTVSPNSGSFNTNGNYTPGNHVYYGGPRINYDAARDGRLFGPVGTDPSGPNSAFSSIKGPGFGYGAPGTDTNWGKGGVSRRNRRSRRSKRSKKSRRR